MLYARHHDFVYRYGIAGSQMTTDRVLIVSMLFVYSFTYTGVQHYFHIICRLTVTRRVSHVKQELLSIPDHMTSCLLFSWVRSLVSVQCFVDRCLSFFARPLCFTDSDYSFSIDLTYNLN